MSERKKILLLCPYPEDTAPGQRLRYEQYLKLFKQHGYDFEISAFMTIPFWKIVYKKGYLLQKVFWTLMGYLIRIRDLFRLRKYDAVYVFLWVTPFGPPIFEWLVCMIHPKVIYDIDDMIFLGHSSEANGFIEVMKGKRKVSYLMKKAKHIVVSTPKNEEFASQFNKNITDISVAINTEVYLPVNTYSNKSVVTIGWSGSHSTSRYLRLLEDVLRKFSNRKDVRILAIGDTSFRFSDFSCDCIPWVSATEVPDLQQIDIGLYPLPFNEPWVYGKSGGKALQYMALGIPTIATALGTNFRIIDDGVSGYLVKEMDEWVEKIEYLIQHPEERKRIGQAGRLKVEKDYSLLVNKQLYLDIFKRVIS